MEILLLLLFAFLTVVFFIGIVNAKKNKKPVWVLVLFALAATGFLWWTIKSLINVIN
ncbi:hypothetical protein [Piscibacillus salipiscarius]|uniref:Uncharacterized protein n=1 Tax=Piscibacillus salipiscarius TaxID=299480 RepID=A0ABW5QB70_9BACI